jgi:hypothetical protein
VPPWAALIAALTPHYANGEGRGRPPIGLERMLRMYVAQQCFGLSDEGTEDALYDSQAIRRFFGALSVSTFPAKPPPMRPRCSSFAACSRRTS